jgi:hypothetical protein
VDFLDGCLTATPPIPPEPVALALLTAGTSEKAYREAQSVELVWTGPDAGVVPFRRTEQAILQVLDSASRTITLVSYAAYSIPNIREALVRAARRNVKTTIIVETPDRIAGQQEYSTLQALGPEVAACSTVYFWPQANGDEKKKPGPKPETRNQAVEWLRDLLRSGPMASKDIQVEAKEAGYAWRTVHRAKDDLAIKPYRQQFGSEWMWRLPSCECVPQSQEQGEPGILASS